jgi:hypothetical protein
MCLPIKTDSSGSPARPMLGMGALMLMARVRGGRLGWRPPL